MKRLLCLFAAYLAFLPLTAYSASPSAPYTTVPVAVPQIQAKPLEAPVAVVQAPLEEIPVPAPEPVYEAPVAPVAPVMATGTISGCGDNSYAQFIYQHESGCRLNAQNAGGCLGIGQACPGSKLLAVCPDLNYACQNQFFTQYAVAAYGSWEGAYNAWVSKSWW